ncbi:MAG: hypothetical protein ACYCZR_05060 [Burkholderiales bacterium]
MGYIEASACGRITVTKWHTDWHVCINVGGEVGSTLWLTREEAEALPAQIARALADRDRHDSGKEEN